ncbi:hypothetical protein ScPMuIL_001030 [Solemya velum]
MGKKHKKHHKSEKKSHDDEEYERSSKEPLKLVLKVTNPDADEVYSHGSHEERRHKHKKKKKKKSSEKEKHKHHSEDKSPKQAHIEKDEDMSTAPEEDEPAAKRLAVDSEMEHDKVEDTEVKEANPLLMRQADEPTILKGCLKYIQSILQRKDINGFFAYPVNDVIAPGYSSIIQHPVDFSTMLTKIEAEEYHSVMDYKKDFELMCNNAMTYNRPDTIYYKEAKKLLYIGRKQMSKEKLMIMKRNLGFMGSITSDELGFDEPESEVSVVTNAIIEKEKEQKKKSKAKSNLSKFEAIPDNMTPEEILTQAQAAAKEAAESLTLRKPKADYGFLRRREDGSSSLTIINPENNGIVSDKERIVDIATVVGKLNAGTWSISGFKEDKRNKVSPVNYLGYGPFSSYAPQYDSSFANITKDESDLLLSTYGNETGVQYAKSVKSYVENSGDYVNRMVDRMLDILTKGEHSKTQCIIDERRREEEQKLLAEEVKENLDAEIRPVHEFKTEGNISKSCRGDFDLGALRSLGDLGVDVSFLDQYEKDPPKDKVQEKLDHTASLIQDLQQTQSERLCARPPLYLCDLPGPSEKEMQLAQRVTEELKDLAKEVAPSDITSLKGIREAMGISLEPTETDSSSEVTDNPVTSELSGAANSPAQQTSEPISAMDIDQEFQEFFQQNTTDMMSDKDAEETLAANMC